ncbi:MAG: hypothetical protein JWL73_390 [Actinomycetia bacterium]|nr:hypothetical protein [Actinomycetes bacterium]
MTCRRGRVLALGGLIGPVAFVAAWVATGLSTDHYSPVHDAISELARLGAPTRVAMTTGFVVFGVAVTAYARPLRAVLAGPSWIAVAVTGMATLGVAAFPLGFDDSVHAAFAGLGYVALTAAPLLAVGPLRAAGFRHAAFASLVLGLLCAAGLLLSVTSGPTGLFQRAALTVGDIWLAAGAVAILAGRRASPVQPGR